MRGGDIINSDKEILIGDNVWICCNSFVTKGVIIPSNSIIASNSKVTKILETKNGLYVNNRLVKSNIYFKS